MTERPPSPEPDLVSEAVEGAAGRIRRHRIVAATLVVVVVAMLTVEIVLVAPYISRAAHLLAHPHWTWLALALAAEAASMVSFARLQRRMLPSSDVKIKLGPMIAVTYAANAMSVTIPGGQVLSSTYTFRKLRAWGLNAPVVSLGLIASGLLSSLTLTVIIVLGATLARSGTSTSTVIIEAVLVVLAVVLGREVMRRPRLMLRFGRWSLLSFNLVRRRPSETGLERVAELVEQFSLVRARKRDWVLGLVYASLNWADDLLCLVASCRAVGASGPGIELALVTYAAGKAASNVPLLPGGLGVVDAALVLALTRGGFPAGVATAGVIVYRVISFGLVALAGWVLWLVGNRLDHRRIAIARAERIDQQTSPVE